MRVREPVLPAWLGYLIAAPFAVAVLPAVAIGFGLAGLVWAKRKALGPTKQWSRWFAWYPVRVGFDDKRWLEIVERRSFAIMGNTYFRAVKHITA